MDISLLAQRNKKILVTLVALIILTTIIWHYEKSVANYLAIIRNYEQSSADHLASIHSLQEQLSEQKHSNQQLIANLGQAQATWQDTETELQELKAMDWEKKYTNVREENESLRKEITGLKFQYDIDLARLQRAQGFLSEENNSMRENRFRLEKTNQGLEQDILKLKTDIGLQNKTIARLESVIKQQKQSLASLQKPVEENPAPEPPVVQPATAQTAVAGENKSDVYRLVRLQSLSNAIKNQDSVARKNILVSVIPTIPDGVSGAEFLSLVTGMHSEDIMATIQLTNKYITRPLDSKTLSDLTGIMNEKDAETASLVFKKQE